MGLGEHWERAYRGSPTDKLGWYEPHLRKSLEWIRELQLDRDANIIDVGGGASTLVDDLLDEGYPGLTVVDLSGTALATARERLGDRAQRVTWLEGDISSVDLRRSHYHLWHDRAVFHFLTDGEQRERYRVALLNALRPRGHLIIATFAPEAPPRCSGLPVQRYDADQLAEALGPDLELRRHEKELHITPGGVEQMYLYCEFERKP